MGKYEMLFSLNKAIQNIGGRILSLKRIPQIVSDRDYLKENEALKFERKSDRCYVVGLGPSLKKVDFENLDGDLIVTNRFFKFDSARSVSPKYYMLMDDAYFRGYATDDLKMAYQQYPNSTFIFNGKYRKYVADLINDDNNCRYMYSWNGWFNGRQELRVDRLMPAFGNVVCCAIAFALSIQYKEIILLGCDFNSFATQKVEHCYTESKDRKKLRNLASELFLYSFDADMHDSFSRYAAEHGVSILNGTEESLIDSYPICKIKEL